MNYWKNKEMAFYDVAEMITNLDCTGIECDKCPFYTKIELFGDGPLAICTCAKSDIAHRLEAIRND